MYYKLDQELCMKEGLRMTAVELGLSEVAVATKHRSFRGQGGVG
jgi:hypothetical protein